MIPNSDKDSKRQGGPTDQNYSYIKILNILANWIQQYIKRTIHNNPVLLYLSQECKVALTSKDNQYNSYSNTLKKQSHMTISTDAEKTF